MEAAEVLVEAAFYWFGNSLRSLELLAALLLCYVSNTNPSWFLTDGPIMEMTDYILAVISTVAIHWQALLLNVAFHNNIN